MPALPTHTDVLIVGAGPTGLTLATSLAQLGVDHVLIDRNAAPQAGSKAAAVQPRALEYLDRLGVADGLIADGLQGQGFQVHDGERTLLRLPYTTLDTPFPFLLQISQQATEGHLARRLTELGGTIHRDHRLITCRQLLRIRDHGYEVVCDVPGLLSGNGMAWVDQRLLIADSLLGLVLSMDPARGTSSVWLAHELLTKTDPASPLPCVNGIAAGHGWVYLTNTERGLLLCCPTDSTDPAKDLQVVAERLAGDGLDVGSDGRIYLATHTWGNSILRLDPDGHREDIAGHDQGITGPTAVAFDPGDTTKLYVTTTGGILSSYGGQIEPARLVRLNPWGGQS